MRGNTYTLFDSVRKKLWHVIPDRVGSGYKMKDSDFWKGNQKKKYCKASYFIVQIKSGQALLMLLLSVLLFLFFCPCVFKGRFTEILKDQQRGLKGLIKHKSSFDALEHRITIKRLLSLHLSPRLSNTD